MGQHSFQILLKLEANVQQDYKILRSQKVLAKFIIILVAYLDFARMISGVDLFSRPRFYDIWLLYGPVEFFWNAFRFISLDWLS